MFTGLIEAVGTVKAKKLTSAGDLILTVHSDELDFSDVKLGDSIAVNGVCLTATALNGASFTADVSLETVRHSRFTDIKLGETVNLEKAMRLGDRFGGHMVSGHVDGVGEIKSIYKDASAVRIEITPPKEISKYIAARGSITVDGISLTVNELTEQGFLLNIVPHTAAETIIKHYQVSTRVHLEVDLVARYLEQLMKPSSQPNPSRISKETLMQHGFWK